MTNPSYSTNQQTIYSPKPTNLLYFLSKSTNLPSNQPTSHVSSSHYLTNHRLFSNHPINHQYNQPTNHSTSHLYFSNYPTNHPFSPNHPTIPIKVCYYYCVLEVGPCHSVDSGSGNIEIIAQISLDPQIQR